MAVSTLSFIQQEHDSLCLKKKMHHSPLLDTDVQEDGYNCYDLITACESIGDHQPHFQKYPLEDILDKITNEIHQLQVTDKELDEKGGGYKRPINNGKGLDAVDGPTKRPYQKRANHSLRDNSITIGNNHSLGVPQNVCYSSPLSEAYASHPGGSEKFMPLNPPSYPSGHLSPLCFPPNDGKSQNASFQSSSRHSSFSRTVSVSSVASSSSSSAFSLQEEESEKRPPGTVTEDGVLSFPPSNKYIRIKMIEEYLLSLPSPPSGSVDVCGPPDFAMLSMLQGPSTAGVNNNNHTTSLGERQENGTRFPSLPSSPWATVASPGSSYASPVSPDLYTLPPTPVSPDHRTLSPDPPRQPSPFISFYPHTSASIVNSKDPSVINSADPVMHDAFRSPSVSSEGSTHSVQLSQTMASSLTSPSQTSSESVAAPLSPFDLEAARQFVAAPLSPFDLEAARQFVAAPLSPFDVEAARQWSPASDCSEDSLTEEDIINCAIGEDKQWRQDEYGDTYLHYLVTLRDEAAAEKLNVLYNKIGLKGVINRCNKETETPLYSAVEMGKSKLTRLLLTYGADVNMYCRNKSMNMERTPLHVAVEKGDIDIVNILLHCEKINVDAPRSPDNYTPLLVALEKHQPGHPVDDRSKIIKLLIEADASLSAKDGRSGNTVLMMAVARKDVSVVQLILDTAGAVEARELVRQQSLCGNSALHVAAGLQNINERLQQQLFQLLIRSGGDTELKNNEGDTPKNFNRNLLAKAGKMK
ncbi:uncharacterized protein LOC112567861 isoform X1 [Pomacea canaliculata]|uniref:uncharacterized protein LOC112567861 isoform X1 n=2 Tax=Pomacea canaliculata TaxID=400727 RepID=UPI000D73A3EE|nr:uncharacterized protein LOC112567861 isoform X1 [Pomacea canaliculata]